MLDLESNYTMKVDLHIIDSGRHGCTFLDDHSRVISDTSVQKQGGALSPLKENPMSLGRSLVPLVVPVPRGARPLFGNERTKPRECLILWTVSS